MKRLNKQYKKYLQMHFCTNKCKYNNLIWLMTKMLLSIEVNGKYVC